MLLSLSIILCGVFCFIAATSSKLLKTAAVLLMIAGAIGLSFQIALFFLPDTFLQEMMAKLFPDIALTRFKGKSD